MKKMEYKRTKLSISGVIPLKIRDYLLNERAKHATRGSRTSVRIGAVA